MLLLIYEMTENYNDKKVLKKTTPIKENTAPKVRRTNNLMWVFSIISINDRRC